MWAFAKLDQLDEKLLVTLARAALLRMSQFNAQEIANTAWAFATLGYLDENLFAALGQHDDKLFSALAREAEHGRSHRRTIEMRSCSPP